MKYLRKRFHLRAGLRCRAQFSVQGIYSLPLCALETVFAPCEAHFCLLFAAI
jgi:hypothetical protein